MTTPHNHALKIPILTTSKNPILTGSKNRILTGMNLRILIGVKIGSSGVDPRPCPGALLAPFGVLVGRGTPLSASLQPL